MTWTRIGSSLALLAALAMAPACGGGSGDDGGGGPTPTPQPNIAVSFSIATLDGYVQSNGVAVAGGASPPWAGDIDHSVPNRSASTYYSFDITGLPPGAVILDATVNVSIVSSTGSPYTTYGNLDAWYAPYGNDLANVVGLFVVNPPPVAPFSPAADTPGVKQAAVASMIVRALDDGSSMLQIGVGFGGPSNNDGVGNWVNLTDAENVAGTQPAPMLSITWSAP